MLELIAQGPQPDMRWRRPLPEGVELVIGRQTELWPVRWDPSISRRHLIATRSGELLHIRQIPGAANAVFYQGEPCREFALRPGEHFVIGETTFTMTASEAFPTLQIDLPVRQRTFSPHFLEQLSYGDADRRIEILAQLPDVIGSATNESELFDRVTHLLLAGIRVANQVAIVEAVDGEAGVLHWDDRQQPWLAEDAGFQPSQRLIMAAIEQDSSVLHLWEGPAPGVEFTVQRNVDWAFVVPLRGNAGAGKGIYVAGHRMESEVDPEGQLQREIKFTKLIATTLSAVMESARLQRRQASLRAFFAPEVMAALSSRDPETALAPRECPVSVLFSDLRGFSRASEEQSSNLIGWLEVVSRQLGVVTGAIRERGGVIGDFHGDAVMGFWGWPVEHARREQAAVEAAVSIQEGTAAPHDRSLRSPHLGIGIASGNAVCGTIGTEDQVKVTAFGPVVNLAARLEGLTRQLSARVLIDDTTAARLVGEAKWERKLRRRGRFQPAGMAAAYDIYELAEEDWPADQLAELTRALEAFESGDWNLARRSLNRMPAGDAAREFLSGHVTGSPPDDWDGVIRIETK